MNTGLVIGKFAPLHKGHQLLIETALTENDRVIVMIYEAPETTVPLPVRAGWIRSLYADVEVIEAWNGSTVTGDTPEIRQLNEDYLCSRLAGESITHFYSSEFYGEHISRALNALDRRIDPERKLFPVSGSQVRNDPYGNRHFLDPLVYKDLVARIAFMGAPSTGKTSIAKALAQRYKTVWMPEYGREYWLEHQQDRRLTPGQLLDIAEGHIEREEQLLTEANRFLFVDTEAITTWHFAIDYHGSAHPELDRLATQAEKRYALFFLCSDDIPYDDTWERSGLQYRARFQKQIRSDLIRRHIPFVTLNGPLDRRLQKVCSVLDGFDRYISTGDQLLALTQVD